MRTRRRFVVPRPAALRSRHTLRRHVDLMRVTSALCPGTAIGR